MAIIEFSVRSSEAKKLVIFMFITSHANSRVTSEPKTRYGRQKTNSKTTKKMPTRRKIRRDVSHKLEHIYFGQPHHRLLNTQKWIVNKIVNIYFNLKLVALIWICIFGLK